MRRGARRMMMRMERAERLEMKRKKGTGEI